MGGEEGWRVVGSTGGATGGPAEAPKPRHRDPKRGRMIAFAVATVVLLGLAATVYALTRAQPEEPIALDETYVGVALGAFKGVVRTATKDTGVQYHFGDNKEVPDEPGNNGAPLLGIEVSMPGDTVPIGTPMACAWSEPSTLPAGLRQASTLFHLSDTDDPDAWGAVGGPWQNVTTIRLPVADGIALNDVVALAYDETTEAWTSASIADIDAGTGKVTVQIGRPTAVMLAAPAQALDASDAIPITGFVQAAADLADAAAMATYTAWHATHPDATRPAQVDDATLQALVAAQAPLLANAQPAALENGPAALARVQALLAANGQPQPLWAGTEDEARHMVLAYAAGAGGVSIYDPDVPGQGLTIPIAGGLGPYRGNTHYAVASYVGLGADSLYGDPASEVPAPVVGQALQVTLTIDEPAFYSISLYVVLPDGNVAWTGGSAAPGTFESLDDGAAYTVRAGADGAPLGEYQVWVQFDDGPGPDPTGRGTVTVQVGEGDAEPHAFAIAGEGGGNTNPAARGSIEAPNQGWAFIAAVAL